MDIIVLAFHARALGGLWLHTATTVGALLDYLDRERDRATAVEARKALLIVRDTVKDASAVLGGISNVVVRHSGVEVAVVRVTAYPAEWSHPT